MDFDKIMKYFKSKAGTIDKIFAYFFSIVSLILSIIALIKGNSELAWWIVLFLVIFNSIFLITLSIFETFFVFKTNKKVKECQDNCNSKINGKEIELEDYCKKKQDLIDEKDNYINALKKDLERTSMKHSNFESQVLYYYQYIINSLNVFSTKLYTLNKSFRKGFQGISHITEFGKELNGDSRVKLGDHIVDSREELIDRQEDAFIAEYRHFLGNIVGKLKETLDKYLELFVNTDRYKLEVAISIKQYNRIVDDINNLEDIKVITAFRDNKTYTTQDQKREIAAKEYHVDKNTDFQMCLTQDCYRINNATSETPNYANEHEGFEKYYNCSIVSPIVCKYPNDLEYRYGYLAIDVLNKDTKREPLTAEMEPIVIATARLIGNYTDSIVYQWRYLHNIVNNDNRSEINELMEKDLINEQEEKSAMIDFVKMNYRKTLKAKITRKYE